MPKQAKICRHGFKKSDCERCEAIYQKKYQKKYKAKNKSRNKPVKTWMAEYRSTTVKKFRKIYSFKNIIAKAIFENYVPNRRTQKLPTPTFVPMEELSEANSVSKVPVQKSLPV